VTNEEIMQSLRICATHIEKGCGLCPQMKYVRCTERLADEAITMIERLSGEVEDLRRKLAMSDKDVTAAHLHFSQWQAAFIQLTQTVSRIEDEDKVGELCAAIKAQLAAWEKAMEGTP
jgi:septation ring formation regulator EzrA